MPGYIPATLEIEKLIRELERTEPDFYEITRPRRIIRRALHQQKIECRIYKKAHRAAAIVTGKIAPPVKPHTVQDRRDRESIFIESFEVPVTGEETLFCDTDFLESFFKKPVKKAEECQEPGKE